MGFPTRVQLIQRQASEQWYINFPSAIAQAMEFSKGELVEWIIQDSSQLLLRRLHPPELPLKKTSTDCSTNSTGSGSSAPPASPKRASPTAPKRSR